MVSAIEQRREQIMALAYKHGYVSVKQLAEEVSASEATIRRDIHILAAQGQLELTHGGATLIRNSDYSFNSKFTRNLEGKSKIARLASALVQDGDQIFLDSGTTCFALSEYLRGKRSLSVIVNSIRTAQEMQAAGLNILILGGQFRPERMDTVGPMACEMIERLRGYRAFIGCDGMSMDFGLTSVDIDSAHLFGLASRNCRELILLADSSKFDNPSLYKIIDFSAVNTVITDVEPNLKWSDFFAQQNISVIHPN